MIGNVFLLVFVIWTLIPFYWMLVTSLKEHDEIYGTTRDALAAAADAGQLPRRCSSRPTISCSSATA